MPLRQIIAILVVIIAAIALSEFLFQFYDWNREQACATSGGRNCGGVPARLER